MQATERLLKSRGILNPCFLPCFIPQLPMAGREKGDNRESCLGSAPEAADQEVEGNMETEC